MNVKIKEDEDLLAAMMGAQRAVGYAPSSHWSGYEEQTLLALKSVRLSEFLRVPNSFGNFSEKEILRPSILQRVLFRIRRRLFALFGFGPATYPMRIVERSLNEQIAFMAYEFAEALYVNSGGHRLLEIEDSLAGDPPAKVMIHGRWYSVQFLYYFARAQWLLQHLALPEGAGVAEVGPGYGGFMEVLRKLRPDLRIVLVDIAPQLYIIEQRVKAVFGEANVIGFRETTKIPWIDLQRLQPGQIAIVAPWDASKIRNIWLGINHASMQEMTRAQARNYIEILAKSGMQRFYLVHHRTGVILGADAVTSDFLIECLQTYNLEMSAFGSKQPSDYAKEMETPFHDYFLFAIKSCDAGQ
jgi:putative sugar O-methyltransferase